MTARTFIAAFDLEREPEALARSASVFTGRIGGHLVGLTTIHELQYHPSIRAHITQEFARQFLDQQLARVENSPQPPPKKVWHMNGASVTAEDSLKWTNSSPMAELPMWSS